jgi:predicted nucleic acid-binding protein
MATPVVSPVYFDSALIAKFYLNEPGRDAVRDVTRQAGVVVTSGVAVAEVAAAFHRKLREGAVDRVVFKALHGQFAFDIAEGLWKLVGPTEALLLEVQSLFAELDPKVFLRSLDAVHIVTARSERFSRLYSNDRHLLAACPRLGLEGVDPTARAEDIVG